MVPGISVYWKTMDQKKKVSKSTARATARQLLLTERAIFLGRLQVLEGELQRIICLRETLGGRVFLTWWHNFYRRDIILRLQQLNQLLGFNVALQYTRV